MKINYVIFSLFAVTALGFTANANAVNAEAEATCPGCHGVVINGMQAVGTGGGKNCPPLNQAGWVELINRMNVKNCGVNDVAGVAAYLAAFGTTTGITTTTTTTVPVTTTTTTVPVTTTTTTVPVTTTTTTVPVTTTTTTVPVTTTTTTVPVTTTTTTVPVTTTTTTVPVTTSTTTVPVTTSTTTTTTLPGCNTHVNGTTRYKYSGSGSCHGHGDDGTGNHIVQDQKWCQKHMTHFNSQGNHTHAYPHPLCM